MLYSKLLVALFALPVAFAQDAAQSTDAAAADGAAAPAGETPAADAGAAAETPAADGAAAAGTDSAAAPAETTKKGSVGGNTENTGHGMSGNGTGAWNVTTFSAPSDTIYWVNEAVNEARWEPYEAPVDLVIFNSNTSLLAEQRTVANNIPAGTGTWSGMISGFLPGNNYILVLALTSDPTRKIAQTRGFWIKRNGTIPYVPLTSEAAAGATVSGGVAASGSVVPTAPAESAGASGAAASSPAGSGTSGARALAASAAGVFAAGALALTAF